ncbi:alpha/beta hydrolase family protein [Pelagibaculum spongiae]|uniref:Serine aminopeptidase S33 domain-containing protein n=1 Tax=Pelagibaculum spongiae TaxID=2080658 RepID=A0A2V1GSL9_9GAMM|nr:alpha/beta fold hydrolase [Pelagibaculum spongiae]PVZ66366.1 hypothetical protein DC094_16850 [Pelagibaculum spongiae]
MNKSNIQINPIQITTRDGFLLAASEYLPQQENGVALLISPAMGIPRSYYHHFASWLAKQGFVVMSYDYRGMGDSKNIESNLAQRKSLRLTDFGEQDLRAGLDWLSKQHNQLRLMTIGHSLGGQILGLADNNGLAEKSLVIASGSGYWKLYSPLLRIKMWLVMFGIMPLVTIVRGQFPGKLLGGGDDLPRSIALSWAAWCRNPHYVSDQRKQPIRTHYNQQKQMRFIAISDDTDFAPMACVKALQSFYQAESSELLLLNPKDYQAGKIGHFGFFRRNMPQKLWKDTADWLLQSALVSKEQVEAVVSV